MSVNWASCGDFQKTIRAINKVWHGEKGNLFLSPKAQTAEYHPFLGYEFQAPINPSELLKKHPEGFDWLRVETPSDPTKPDLYVPLGKTPGMAGLIISEPGSLRWRHFQDLYRATSK